MSQFDYTAISGGGQRVSGVVRSRSDREAVRKILELGYHPISVEPVSNSTIGSILRLGQRRVRTTDLAVFTRQLSALLKAGLPILQALVTLRRQSSNKTLTGIIQEIEEAVARDAATLSEALERYPRVFDPVYRGLVRSGEESGNLSEVLADLARYLSSAAKLRGQVLGAFIYPIFLLLVGTGAIFVLMAFVIPRFQDLFRSLDQALPWPTVMLIATSTFLAKWWYAVLVTLASGILAFVLALRQRMFRMRFDRLLLTLPVFGQMLMKVEVARISRTLASLIDSGIRIIEALRITGDTARNTAVRDSFSSIISTVTAGEPLAIALEKVRVFPVLMVNLVRTGEDTGELPQMLAELAAIYEDEAERAVNSAVKLLEPMLIMVLGGIIALIVAAVILPIFQANAAIG